MNIADIGIIVGIVIPLEIGQYFIYMTIVDGKIERTLNKMKDDKIAELIRKNDRYENKIELLKDGISKMK